MAVMLKKIATDKTMLKVVSFIIGYTCWFVASQSHYVNISLNVPVVVDNVPEGKTIQVIDSMNVVLGGRKCYLQDLPFKSLAVHIDGNVLREGKNQQSISSKTLFLPEHIKLVHYKPLEVMVGVSN
jgi:hypothetical protein